MFQLLVSVLIFSSRLGDVGLLWEKTLRLFVRFSFALTRIGWCGLLFGVDGWWLLSFDIEMAFRWVRACVWVCVWLGRSMVGNWMVLSARKTHKCCKLLQNYLSVFLNRPNPCNGELRYFFVCRGWLEMDGFKCFCFAQLFLWRLEDFFCLSPLSDFTRRAKKIRNCTDSLIFTHSFFLSVFPLYGFREYSIYYI